MDDIERLEALFKTSLQCYTAAISAMEAHSVVSEEALAASHRERLKEIRKKLLADPVRPTLERTRLDLEATLREHAEQANQHFRRKEDEIRKILKVLANAAEVLSSRNDAYAAQFRGLARELESVSQMSDLTAVRRRLTAGVIQLKDCTDSMWKESRASVTGLQAQLKLFQHRLERAEELAATDPLTALANRREAERLMEEKVRAGELFSIMLFDLDGFKSINDRHGHHAGDQVLKTFASRLLQQFRSSDVVCRWGGDEFLVILSCPLGDSMGRARQIAENLRGRYSIRSASKTFLIEVAASVGVAEHRAGESSEELFARADEFLYHHKAIQSAG